MCYAVLARDLQQVVLYDSEGQFAGVRRPGSGKPQEVEGQWFVIDEILGSSGLQLKSDPGTGVVYAGFAVLMITTIVSYMSHSQIWALQDGDDVHVGGRTNRATAVFQVELSDILESVPERVRDGSKA
jgi:cytochrome c biogenesis protein